MADRTNLVRHVAGFLLLLCAGGCSSISYTDTAYSNPSPAGCAREVRVFRHAYNPARFDIDEKSGDLIIDSLEASNRDGQIEAWSIGSDEESQVLASGDGTSRLWRFVPGGMHYAHVEGDGEVRVTTRDGKPLRVVTDGVPGRISDLSFSDDGSFAVILHEDQATSLVELSSGRVISRFRSWGASAMAIGTAASPVTASVVDGELTIHDMVDGHVLHPGIAPRVEFALAAQWLVPGRTLIVMGTGASAAIDIQTWKVRYLPGVPIGNRVLMISPDRRLLLMRGPGERDAQIIRASDGKRVSVLSGSLRDVGDAAFSPDGKYVVTGPVGRNVLFEARTLATHEANLWDVSSGRRLARLGIQGEVTSVQFSNNGRFVLTGGGDGSVRLWSVPDGRQLCAFGHQSEDLRFLGKWSAVYRAMFVMGDRFVVSTGEDDAVRVWDVSDVVRR